MIAKILGGKSCPPPCAYSQPWLQLLHHSSVLTYELHISRTLETQNGKAMNIRKRFCGTGHDSLSPLDSTDLQSTWHLSQFLCPFKVILLSPPSRRMFVTHRGTLIVSDVILKVTSSTWVLRKLTCSLELCPLYEAHPCLNSNRVPVAAWVRRAHHKHLRAHFLSSQVKVLSEVAVFFSDPYIL